MTTIEARCQDGSSVKVSKVESVGDIMFYFAKIHKQFASDVEVACPDTGANLSNLPSQISPPIVQVAVKPEAKRSIEDLLLTLRLHSKHEDDATCVFAYAFLRREYRNAEKHRHKRPILKRLLKEVLEEGACGDAKIERNILRTLIGLGVNANYFLQEAAGNGNEGRVRMLLAEGVPVERPYDSGSKKSCDIPALSTAAWEGRAGIVEVLLAHRAEVNREAHLHEMPSIPVCDKPGVVRSPLILACYNGHADVVKILIDHKANINQRSMYTWPLHAACSQGHIDVVRTLLLKSADVNYSIPFLRKEVPIMWASEHGDVDLTKLLLSHKAKVQFFDDDFNTPLMTALRVHADASNNHLCGKLQVMKLLLAHNASANIGDQETGEKALLTALRNEKMKGAVAVLLDHQADPNAGNVDGLFPLLLAAQNGDAGVVNLLLAHKADPHLNNILETLAADASKKNKAVLELLERFNVHHPSETATAEAQEISHEAVLETSEPCPDDSSASETSCEDDPFVVQINELAAKVKQFVDERKRKLQEMPQETDEEYETRRRGCEVFFFKVAKNRLQSLLARSHLIWPNLAVFGSSWHLTVSDRRCPSPSSKERNKHREEEGKEPIKLGERFLNRMTEFTNDAIYDLASALNPRRKED